MKGLTLAPADTPHVGASVVCVPPTRPLSGRLGRPAGQGFGAPHGKLHVKFS